MNWIMGWFHFLSKSASSVGSKCQLIEVFKTDISKLAFVLTAISVAAICYVMFVCFPGVTTLLVVFSQPISGL